MTTLEETVARYLKAYDRMNLFTDLGQDDSGKRDTPSYPEWIAADCEYTEALAEMRASLTINL